MSLQRSGRGTLNYLGVEATQPPQFLYMKREPTIYDSLNVNIGTIWLYSNYPTSSPLIYELYVLADLRGGLATWLQLYPVSGNGLEIVTDNGTAEPVDGILNVKEAAANQGSARFQGSGNNVSINFTDNDTALDTGLGLHSLEANTGINNANLTAFGANTLRSATSVSNCSAFGVRAMQSLTSSGADCDAFGVDALAAATTATRCQAFGKNALKSATTAVNCSAFGISSQFSNLTGSNNCSFGNSALGSTTSSNSSAFGSGSLASATSGLNDAFGAGSLGDLTTGTNNSSFGYASMNSTTTGGQNAVFGQYALKSNVSGSANTAVGYSSQENSISAGSNDSLGYYSLNALTTGEGNCGLGFRSLRNITTGNYNTCIGLESGLNYASNEENNICIGNSVQGLVGETNSVRIGSTVASGELSNTIKIGTGDAQFIALGFSNSSLLTERNGIRIGFVSESGGSPVSPFNYIIIGGLAVLNDAFNSPIKIGYSNAGTIAIGAQASDTSPNYSIRIGTLGQQKKCYIQGINGVNISSSTVRVVTVDSNGQLGSADILAGANVVVSPSANAITITSSGGGGGTEITFDCDIASAASIGSVVNFNEAAADEGTMRFKGDGTQTVFLLFSDASANTGIGSASLTNVLGAGNTALGTGTLTNLGNGSRNLALGGNSGVNYTGTESDNILIDNAGVVGEDAQIKIGTNGVQTDCYIQGIDGVNVGSTANVVTVASSGKLGSATITSSDSSVTITPGANIIDLSVGAGSSGSLVLIQTQTVSSVAQVAFTSGITNTYNDYVLIWNNVSNGGANIYMQISSDGGSTYLNTGYVGGANQMDFSSTSFTANTRNTTAFVLSMAPNGESSFAFNGEAWLFNFTSVGTLPSFRASNMACGDLSAAGLAAGIGAGLKTTAVVVNAFKVYSATGNISGTFSLYGLVQ